MLCEERVARRRGACEGACEEEFEPCVYFCSTFFNSKPFTVCVFIMMMMPFNCSYRNKNDCRT
jgi:hypothetical protein